MKDLELGWLAGLLEGEGHFGFNKNTQVVSVRMTDKDTMYRLASTLKKITGNTHIVGQIGQPVQPRQEVYYIQLYGENARRIMRAVVKHMCYRRRQHIWRALNHYKPPKMNLNSIMSELLDNENHRH